MEFLGVGPLELFFIILIALIVLGPNDMIKAGRTIGKFLRNLVTSPGWRTIQETSRDLKYLPNKLMRDAGLEEPIKDISQSIKQDMQQINQEIKTALPTQSDLSVDINTIAKPLEIKTAPPKIIKEDPTDWTTPPIIVPNVIIESPAPPDETPVNPENQATN